MKIIEYNSIKLLIPDRYYHSNLINRFEKGIYEKDEENIINKYYNKKDNVLEIGTCLGYLCGLLCKKTNTVISIEANPELKDSLNLYKENNEFTNLIIYNNYISNNKKFVNFQTYDNIVAGSGDREDLNINNVRGWGDTLKMYELETLDLYNIKNIYNVNALVLDIEGGELCFFEEYKNFIEHFIKKITVELHGHLMKDNLNFNNKCLNILKSLNFKIITQNGNTYYLEKIN